MILIIFCSFHEEGCLLPFPKAEASALDDQDRVDSEKQEEELGTFQILDRLEHGTEASASDDQAAYGSVKQEEELGIFQILDKLEQVTDTILSR